MASHFIAVVGPPCGGKSTLARQVAACIDAPHLEMDEFRARLLADSDQRVEHRDIAYRAMHVTAELLAPWCPRIVLDATYTAEVCRAELWRIVQGIRGVLSVIECRVSAGVAEARFRRRSTHPARDLTHQRVRVLARSYPYYTRPEAIVAATGDVAVAHVVRDALEKPLDGSDGPAWCASGLPRESPVPATGDSIPRQQLTPACRDLCRWSSVEPRT